MNKENLTKKLKEEGFVNVYEWHDEPDTEYPEHAHKGAAALYILEGGVALDIGDEKIELREGDRFDVPAGKSHTAKVGSTGCIFLVGEMIEGDS
ncbi:MAG: hypothetical protein AB200_03100 [Parcubacteria bacterium C7867-005]|nr:MAG: hypothetical protein AB200_03100 [Parcubacteria bacterium C7867-005]